MNSQEQVTWNYSASTSQIPLSLDPYNAPAGSWPMLVGVDGRFPGAIRRYPGNLRQDDSTAALVGINPEIVKSFQMQLTAGSAVSIYGIMLFDRTNRYVDVWYKKTDDGATVMRRQRLFTLSAGATVADVSTQANYLYVRTSSTTASEQRVYSWSTGSSTIVEASSRFGQALTALAALDQYATGGGGVSQLGRYGIAYRLYDSSRLRWSPMSFLTTAQPLVADDQYISVRAGVPTGDYDGYSHVEIFLTLSSVGNYSAGGDYYLAYRGTINTNGSLSPYIFDVDLLASTDADDGQGSGSSSVNDDSLPLQYIYNPNIDTAEVAMTTPVVAEIFWQDLGISLLKGAGSAYDVYWSPLERLEPEHRPPLNVYRTKIAANQDITCRFLPCGNYLFLLGGERVYRFSRSGNFLNVEEVANGFQFLNRNSMIVIGTTIYAATPNGILRIASDGSSSFLPGLERLWLDRWGAGKTANPVVGDHAPYFAYDARMGCLFIQNRVLEETLCVWLSTGVFSLLVDSPFQGALTSLDFNSASTMRAFFIHIGGYLCYPNADYDRTYGFTMSGVRLWSGQSTNLYNTAISGVGGSGSSPTITVSSNAFTTDGVTPLTGAGWHVWFLNGNQAGKVYWVSSNTASVLTLHGPWRGSAPAAGNMIAISPVVFGALGSQLWPADPRLTDCLHKNVADNITVVVGRSYNGGPANHAQTYLNYEGVGWIKGGISTHAEVVSSEPRTTAMVELGADALWEYQTQSYIRPRQTLDDEEPSKNWARTHAHGVLLFPWVLSYASNYQFELYEMIVKGRRTPSERARS